jgi:hypothetical protein
MTAREIMALLVCEALRARTVSVTADELMAAVRRVFPDRAEPGLRADAVTYLRALSDLGFGRFIKGAGSYPTRLEFLIEIP